MAKIDIYTKAYCPFCVRALGLLKMKQVEFTEIKIDEHPELRAPMIARTKGAYTVPQIFIGDQHIGGCDDLMALERANKLDTLLSK
ncbi:MAG: glutaredoxin 3 [Psychrosphaera sp.]|jgi:glutaredoxin 3|uniref:Glutaredoxin n=1 Tax=Psychrosphaera aquimarina TaxID=2044854 RepID=A0ABU3R1R4_9GAMM|nr:MULTISPECIES: glutaredoxin 3 [Psychrosphaera]MBU2916910.1 glutaredoxin 3 [Psychrosphaera sp. F3M07]MDU0113599.1 glutaredoxin 3 [Psychrosphaera aquimarina]